MRENSVMASADSAASAELDLVQVGPVEVDPAVLRGLGSPLWELIGDGRRLDNDLRTTCSISRVVGGV